MDSSPCNGFDSLHNLAGLAAFVSRWRIVYAQEVGSRQGDSGHRRYTAKVRSSSARLNAADRAHAGAALSLASPPSPSKSSASAWRNGRTIWIADAHRDDGNRFILRADEKLTAFLELESAVRGSHSFPHLFTGKKHSSLGEKKFQKPLVINSASCACAFFSASLVIPPL